MRKFKLRSSYGLTYRGFLKRRMLTLVEANERLHVYFPNMEIIKYYGSKYNALVYCKDCGKTFTTNKCISGYLYGNKIECERCKYERLLNDYNKLLKVNSLRVTDWFCDNGQAKLKVECNTCGVKYETFSSALDNTFHCRGCKFNSGTSKYVEILKQKNCKYISRHCIDGHTIIAYECETCGRIEETQVANIYNKDNICEYCNPNSFRNKFTNSLNEIAMYTKENGIVLIDYINNRKVKSKHLFCGKLSRTTKRNVEKGLLCGECVRSITMGKRKDHNKHLVQEYLVILKNVQKLKHILEDYNQLESFPEGDIKTILEHIDGWVKNYEEIMNEYPNGDLGSILEKNPLYERCKELFYPTMDKFGIEKIK